MTVQLQSTYRIGSDPPALCSLQPGELFVEIDIATGVAPRLWVGTKPANGYSGNVALIVALTPKPAHSDIVIDPVANPSPDNQVSISGTVAPGAVIELAALAGLDPDHFEQLNPWSPVDASSGSFAVSWWLQAADNVRIRARMHDDPQTYVDSNLFQVTDPALTWPR
jgi:hypothetical protein